MPEISSRCTFHCVQYPIIVSRLNFSSVQYDSISESGKRIVRSPSQRERERERERERVYRLLNMPADTF